MVARYLWATVLTAFLLLLAVPVHAQTDMAVIKTTVHECVNRVRQDANRPENYQFGQPPMWKNFDAYVSPDGRVYNNARLVGEMDGVYRFEKCLSENGITLGTPSVANPPKPAATCADDELDQHPGDCWIKLSLSEKKLTLTGFEYGWLHGYGFTKRQQYEWSGATYTHFLPQFDLSKLLSYFDQLYQDAANRTIRLDDAFDLALRMQTNPETKDVPALVAMYRKHEEPMFSGYLRKFVQPNKVIVSEFSDAYHPTDIENKLNTITLLGISADSKTNKAVGEFMRALLNIKKCNTLIPSTEVYKHYTYLKTDTDRQNAKNIAERGFYPQLEVVVHYPLIHEYQQEEFFNERDELSAIILLKKEQTVCYKEDGGLVKSVNLGQLMLDGSTDHDEYDAQYIGRRGNDFINFNQYLGANELRSLEDDESDPRPARKYFNPFKVAATPKGVQNILTIGAEKQ
jgi:hypothetical protein